MDFVDALAAACHSLPAGFAVLEDWVTMAGEHPQEVLDAPLRGPLTGSTSSGHEPPTTRVSTRCT